MRCVKPHQVDVGVHDGDGVVVGKAKEVADGVAVQRVHVAPQPRRRVRGRAAHGAAGLQQAQALEGLDFEEEQARRALVFHLFDSLHVRSAAWPDVPFFAFV